MINFMNKQKVTSVFWSALIVTLIVVILGLVIPKPLQEYTQTIRTFISYDLGWFYLLLVTSTFLVCLFFIVSPIGQIRLGDPGSRPEHSTASWIAMLFSAGMGIGLVFWGAAEPLSHFAIAPPTATSNSEMALAESFKYTFFHWGIHAWAVYAIVALSLAYFQFRKKENIMVSVTLKPLSNRLADGIFGKAVDCITVFSTVVGVATTLGFGAAQINGGLSWIFGIPNTGITQIVIILVTTFCFILSAMSGVGKGVKLLSNLNLILAILLLAIVIAVGPTVLIMNTFVDSIGAYIQGFFRMSFRSGALNLTQQEWIQNWTIFYWAWWISWSPFVGVFIARISKGRTIREFLCCVLLIPTLLSFLWFSAFGTLSTNLQLHGFNLIQFKTEEILFAAFSAYPLGSALSLIAIVLVFSFFITSADSATFVLGMLSENGSLQPSNITKLIWGILLAGISISLLIAGGLIALQNVLIIVALPFSGIMVLMMIALYKELRHEQQEMGLLVKPEVYPSKEEPFKSYEE